MSPDPTPPRPPELHRVVVAYDGSEPATTALVAGAERARRARVPMLLVCAVEVADLMSVTTFTRSAGDTLLRAAERCRTELDVERVDTEVTFGAAAVALLDHARPGDLLVVGTHGHRPVARVLLGSTSSSLVTLSRHPVLVARPGTAPADAPVVVGVDGSSSSTAAVATAAEEADRRGVPLRAVAAVPPVVDAAGLVSGPDAAEVQTAEAFVSEALAGVHERYPDLVVERVVTQEHPVQALTHASRQAQLVVVGSRSRGTLRALLLGSVSREVVQHAGCSVEVVRPAPLAAVQDRPEPAAAAGR